jgi:O-antigen ligase
VNDIVTGTRRFFQSRRIVSRRDWFIVAAVMVFAWSAGSAIASGGRRAVLALCVGVVAIAAPVVGAMARTRVRRDWVAIELPAFLVLMGELVFRERDAESLASNPLDPAGLYRVACLGLALLLGCLALTSPIGRAGARITTRPFRLYIGYVLVVFIGAPLSINPLLSAYRGVELAIGVIVLAGAYRRAGQEAMERILLLLYWFTALSAILIWLEAAAMPGSAFTPVRDSPLPVQLHGVLPSVSANGTGTIGALLALWSLARILSPKERGGASVRTLGLLTVLGLTTLIFAQYRTGYVITVVGVLLVLALRAKAATFWVVVVGAVVVLVWGGQIAREAVPALERGANLDTIRSLSGRLDYWSHALPVWRESPLFGRGLLTASRYEVLAELGSVYTSSLHGTWVEALVGTGVVGVALLAASVLVASARAVRAAFRADGRVVPMLLLVILLVRSITGPTFEVAGSASIMLLALMLLLRDESPTTAGVSSGSTPLRAAA